MDKTPNKTTRLKRGLLAAGAIVSLGASAVIVNEKTSRTNTGIERVEEDQAEKIALDIEETLNKGESYTGIDAKRGYYFTVNEDKVGKYGGVVTVYNPLLLGKDKIGAILVDQKTARADVMIFSNEDGNVSYNEATRTDVYEPVKTLDELRIAPALGREGYAAVDGDEVFIGQVARNS